MAHSLDSPPKARPVSPKTRAPWITPRGSGNRSGEGFVKPSRMMRSSPPAFRRPPHWGHDVGDRLSNPLGGLVGSKTEFSVPSVASNAYVGNLPSGHTLSIMDIGIIAGVALII